MMTISFNYSVQCFFCMYVDFLLKNVSGCDIETQLVQHIILVSKNGGRSSCGLQNQTISQTTLL